MSDNDTNQNHLITSYSNISLLDAQERLGFEMQSLHFNVIPISDMLAIKSWVGDYTIKSVKEKVYSNIVDYIGCEGYPSESTMGFCEANVNDLVSAIIIPIISGVRSDTGMDLRLRRKKEIVSVDGNIGGRVEFVVQDAFDGKFVLVVESEKSSLGEAMKRCLLSMKDMRDINGYGEVYGFITTGERWRMFRYNGISFRGTRKMDVVFEGMENDKDSWLEENSALVECMNAALSEELLLDQVANRYGVEMGTVKRADVEVRRVRDGRACLIDAPLYRD